MAGAKRNLPFWPRVILQREINSSLLQPLVRGKSVALEGTGEAESLQNQGGRNPGRLMSASIAELWAGGTGSRSPTPVSDQKVGQWA